jgi:HEAT repeat protein
MTEYEKITSLISKKEYEEATNEIFNLIRSAQDVSNKENIYKSLEYLNLICDKNPTVVSKIIAEIEIFINDPDDWIRLITLEILYRISVYSPDDIIELIEKIKDRLWDSDPSVRSLGVKILGTIINRAHVDLSDEVSFIVQKLIDVDWKVKMIASNKIDKLINEQPDKIKEVNQLIESASMNLRDENEDIREASGKILKSLGLSILGRKEFFRVLFDLLEEDDWRVRETIIWILGEISHICSQEISHNLPRLIELLGDSHYIIQSKTIEMLVKISEINFDMLMKMLINTLESDNIEIRNNIEEAIIYLGGENIQNVSYYIFENLDNPSPKIRNSITTILINLYAEVGDDFESEIFNIFNQFESKQWRQRKKLVNLLTEIALLLKNGKIYTWIGAELKNIYDSEDDVEVKEEIEINLERLKSEFPNLEMEIDKVQIEVEFLHNSISYFTNFPASFREKISNLIKNLQFDKAEMELNERVKDFLKELDDFDNKIRNYNIKPLVIDLLEEWEDIKVQTLEEISIIKEYEVEKLKSKKEKFRIDLKEKIKNIEDRIKILSVEFDLIKDFDHKLKSYISNRDALLSLEN